MDKDIRLISIIIPCYNCSATIRKTLESLLLQNVHNFEVIFIDDGSNDNSYNIAKEILDNTQISYKLIKQKNSGVSVARNKGIDIAKGKYLYFLDADDSIDNNFVEFISNIDNEDFDICFFNYRIHYKDRTINLKNENKYSLSDQGEILKNILNQTFNYHIGSVVIKRNLIKDKNIYFIENCKYGEDQEFLIKSLCNSKVVRVEDYCFFNYCMRDNSAIHKFPKSRIDAINCAIRIEKYVSELYNDEIISDLCKKYVANQILHNIRSFTQVNKINKINKNIKNSLINEIKINKDYIDYLDYMDKLSIKKVLMKFMVKNNLRLYILLHQKLSNLCIK